MQLIQKKQASIRMGFDHANVQKPFLNRQKKMQHNRIAALLVHNSPWSSSALHNLLVYDGKPFADGPKNIYIVVLALFTEVPQFKWNSVHVLVN